MGVVFLIGILLTGVDPSVEGLCQDFPSSSSSGLFFEQEVPRYPNKFSTSS